MAKYGEELAKYIELNERLVKLAESIVNPPALRGVIDLARRFGEISRFPVIDMSRFVPPNIAEAVSAMERQMAELGASCLPPVSAPGLASLPMVVTASQLQKALSAIQLPMVDLTQRLALGVGAHVARTFSGLDSLTSMYGLSAPAAQAALQAPVAYQMFAIGQLKKVKDDSEVVAGRRVQVLEHAGTLVDEIQTAVEAETVAFPEQASEYDEGSPPVNLFGALNQSLSYVYVEERDVDVSAAFSVSSPRLVSGMGLAIVDLIVRVNDSCRRAGLDPIFKPTSRAMLSSAVLSSVIADTEDRLAGIVDHLFFMLYEGTGEAKRLTPLLGDRELEPLWAVKHLRLANRHDIEHGSESDIRAKHKKIGDAVDMFIGQRVLATTADCKRLQARLYLRVLEMLRRALVAITDGGGTAREV